VTKELPPLPKGWVWTQIKDVGAIRLGRQRSPKNHHGPHMRPYLRVANVFEDRIDLSDVMEMNFTPEEYETFALRYGDVLLNEGQSPHLVGRPALYRGELPGGCYTNSLVRFRAHPGVEPKYALTIFRAQMHLQRYMKIAKITTNIAHLGAGRFSNVEFPLAPLPEQRRIVAAIEQHFSRRDDAVATLERVQAKLGQTRASVLKAAVEGRLVPTEAAQAGAEGRDYEHASVLLERILVERREMWEQAAWEKEVEKAKQKVAKARRKAEGRPLKRGEKLDPVEWEHIGEDEYCRYLPKGEKWKAKYKEPVEPDVEGLPALPTGWVWARWEALCERVTVGFVGPMKQEYRETGVPFLRGGNVRANRYRPDNLLFISREFHRRIWKSRILPGDLLVVRSGAVGTTCVLPESVGEANCSDLVLVQRPAIVPSYGAFYMNSAAKKAVEQGKVGIALTHFNTKSVAALPVAVPPLAEQHRIVAEVDRQLSVLDEVGRLVDANLARCARLRQAILKRAFEGRLVPQDPSDEPASVLLERIKAQAPEGATGRRRGGRA